MKRFQRFQFAAAGLAALGLVFPVGNTLAADGSWPLVRTGAAAPAPQPCAADCHAGADKEDKAAA